MALRSMSAEDLAIRMGLMPPRKSGGGMKAVVLVIVTLAITMGAVWWWPCGGLSLWWKIPLTLAGLIITIVVGVANAD